MGEGGAAGASGMRGATSGGGIDVQFDSCLGQVMELSKVGLECGLESNLDAATLCEENLSDVNLCFLGVEGAGLFRSTCDVASSDVCRAVYR